MTVGCLSTACHAPVSDFLTHSLSTNEFTLIELLAVITIIGILAGLVFAGIQKSRKSARNAHCISNLRQIGMSVNLYVSDYNGRIPGPFQTDQQSCEVDKTQPYEQQFSGVMLPYVQARGVSETRSRIIPNAMLCPVWEMLSNRYRNGFEEIDPNTTPVIWRINSKLFGNGGGTFPGFRYIHLVAPNYARRDATGPEGSLSRVPLIWDNFNPTGGYENKLPEKGRWHGNSYNAAWLDGHVSRERKLTPDSIPGDI
ncbi:MAG: type II secretion system GspH family protein [Opitutaceae bacterium]|nr:type II secretion system GspH family protein [Opitutaceae bacterium]